MSTFLALSVVGLVTGCIYALTATGLVVTYTTAGVFTFAQGAMGMIAAFGFWQLWQGWDVVYERAVGATETDLTADILQMKREGVQLFLTLFNSDQMANFKPQADRQDFRPQYLAPLMYDQSFFKKLGGPQAAEGIYGSLSTALYFGKADAAQIPAVAQFQKFYAQVAGGGAADTFAASAWASTHLLVDAMRKAGPKVTRAAVLANLTATKSFDAGGFYAPGNPGDKKAGNCYVIFQIRGGDYQRTDSPAKGFRCDGKQA